MIRCEFVHALPNWAWSVLLALPPGATVADAVAAARAAWQREPAPSPGDIRIDWGGAVGIQGEACGRDRVVEDGDRVELYRPLAVDPKESRRKRARDARRSGGR